jgi:cellulose synthase/poly-beta-1,6-N-acetylglucosamine synthase-like glycosyltransferase
VLQRPEVAEPRTDELRQLVLDRRFSAENSLGPRTLAVLAALAAGFVAMVALFPAQFTPVFTTAVALLYLISAVDRNLLMVQGIGSPALVSVTADEALALRDDELPVYTVLLPVYREPNIVRNLLVGVAQLDYPADKLEVLLLTEEDDASTRDALRGLSLEGLRVVVVPDSQPKTKPKACNYGMSLPGLRGEMVTIYDAEDIPDPLQLRRAVVALGRAPAEVGCLQARLSYHNESQNLLTRWFSLEYEQWFGAILPAVEQARCVVPLGGTSCHLSTRVWREIGGWDEYNVTEDADLGVRLARYGYRTLILDSVTLEEANSDVINWIRQRSRWYKGYLQTLIVHLRQPLLLRREIGLEATLRLINLTGLVPILNTVNIFLWSTMLVWIVARPEVITLMFPPVTYYLSIALLMIAAPMSVFAGLVTAVALGKPQLWWAALLVPGYWMLQSIAALKALFQLFFRPFYWELTMHGLGEQDSRTASTA